MKQQMIDFLKRRLPGGAQLYRQVRQQTSEKKPIDEVFSGIYQRNEWDSEESVSGPGSTMHQTEAVRARLPSLLNEIGAKSLLDAPCGDFNWMRELSLPLERYIGADIVSELVERNQKTFGDEARSFVWLDLTSDDLPAVDVVLCRDCLVHLSYKMVNAALHNIKKSGAKYLLTTTYPSEQENINIVTGGWRPLNLEVAPFSLPRPISLIDELAFDGDGKNTGKSLALWKLDEVTLPRAVD